MLNIPDWIGLFEDVSKGNAQKILVGNKCDKEYNLENWRESKKQIEGDISGMMEFTTSARVGINIETIF